MNSYKMLKEKHQQEVNAFPIQFAFSNEQFERGMRELGLEPTDTDKICRVLGSGFIRSTDSSEFLNMFNRHRKEREEAIANDKTGEGYILEMFKCELANYEYGYTGDASDAIEALDLTMEEIYADRRMKCAFEKACKQQNL